MVYIPEFYYAVIDEPLNSKRYFYVADRARRGLKDTLAAGGMWGNITPRRVIILRPAQLRLVALAEQQHVQTLWLKVLAGIFMIICRGVLFGYYIWWNLQIGIAKAELASAFVRVFLLH